MRVGTLTIIARSGRHKRIAKIWIDAEFLGGDIELFTAISLVSLRHS